MTRRGFTLLELMIVIALLLAVTSMAAPSLVGILRGSALDGAAAQVESVAVLVRADAQQRSRAVRLEARSRADGSIGIYSRAFTSADSWTGDSAGDFSYQVQTQNDDPTAGDLSDAAWDSPDEERGRLRLVLPRTVTIERSPPGASDDVLPLEAAGFSSDAPAMLDDALWGREFSGLEEEVDITLAVFLPDGGAVSGSPVYLVAGRGRCVEVRINRWTGSVAVRPVRARVATDAVEADAGTDLGDGRDFDTRGETEPAGGGGP